jgi:hypothetical protein
MRQFSTAELVKQIGDVTHAASQAPVAITHHRKRRYVLMTIEQYETLKRSDPRRAFSAHELPPDEAAHVAAELEKSIAQLEKPDGR